MCNVLCSDFFAILTLLFVTCRSGIQTDGLPKELPTDSVLFDSVKVTMTPTMLNGTDRVLLDGVTTEDECRELHRLSNVSQHDTRHQFMTPLEQSRLEETQSALSLTECFK